MNGFIVDMNIVDTVCVKNCRDSVQKNVTITSTSQTVMLKENYSLNVLSVTENTVIIIIQNGYFSIIRTVYVNFDTSICLPCKCGEHIVTIGVKITQAPTLQVV